MESSSSSEADGDDDDNSSFFGPRRPTASSSPAAVGRPDARVILHLDVDAFYCQCESLANPALREVPFAVGQKHIVVTCDYKARALGVRKLMSRAEALRLVPDLVVVEGSDLEPYRRRSREIYRVFRGAVREATANDGAPTPTRRGGMDEYRADLTDALTKRSATGDEGEGDDDAFVVGGGGHRDDDDEDDDLARRLRAAVRVANVVRRRVRSVTGFTTSAGVSTSPMAAKLASDARKPDSCNLLPPRNVGAIVAALPLRRVPGLGSRARRRLRPLWREYGGAGANDEDDDDGEITCADLRRVPTVLLRTVLSEDLLDKCLRGVDVTPVVDDDGGLSRTVSVEDSYRRGTVTDLETAERLLEPLFRRLPRLLDDRRRVDSPRPDDAWPRTVRLTVRTVGSLGRSTTTSRQCPISAKDGAALMKDDDDEDDDDKRRSVLRNAVRRLLREVTSPTTMATTTTTVSRASSFTWNVTKLNVAATNFGDVDDGDDEDARPNRYGMVRWLSAAKDSTAPSTTNATVDRATPPSRGKRVVAATTTRTTTPCSPETKKRKTHDSTVIDPEMLKALPPDIAAEVVAGDHGPIRAPQPSSSNVAKSRPRPRPRPRPRQRTMESFFGGRR